MRISFPGGSRSGSDIIVPITKTAPSGASSSAASAVHNAALTAAMKNNEQNGGGVGKRNAAIESSGSETSSNPAYSQDLSTSQQSFKMAMGNPCEFFVDVM